MADPVPCLPSPCASCPYRKDHPSGVWDASEYDKLTVFDDDEFVEALQDDRFSEGVPSLFLCHQTNATQRETICRGWLTVHQESIVVRIALMRGLVDPEVVYAPSKVDLYASGTEAAAAGMAAIESPSPAALKMIERVKAKGAGRDFHAELPARRRGER